MVLCTAVSSCVWSQEKRAAGEKAAGVAPPRDERQLPSAMRSRMKERPMIRVGQDSGDFTGTDNRVLQAAVDYVGHLGGGTVVIGPGRYLMRDSLHLRRNVTVRGHGRDLSLIHI